VIRSKVSGRRWDIGILIPWLSHEFTEISVPVEAPKEMIYRWTEPMMTGEVIKKIQLKLGQAPDGIFGSKTFYAVKQFQNKMGLVSDGEVGPQTLSALGVK
jgi:peptidoglycan hydrolase-like protein with peptidoglycan-binding domain